MIFFLQWNSKAYSEKCAGCTSAVTINKEWVFEALKTDVKHLKRGEVLWSHKWEKLICYSLNSITELNSRTNLWKNNLVFVNQIKWFTWKDLTNLYFLSILMKTYLNFGLFLHRKYVVWFQTTCRKRYMHHFYGTSIVLFHRFWSFKELITIYCNCMQMKTVLRRDKSE